MPPPTHPGEYTSMNQTPPRLRSNLSKFASVSCTTSLARPCCAASMLTNTKAATMPLSIVNRSSLESRATLYRI